MNRSSQLPCFFLASPYRRYCLLLSVFLLCGCHTAPANGDLRSSGSSFSSASSAADFSMTASRSQSDHFQKDASHSAIESTESLSSELPQANDSRSQDLNASKNSSAHSGQKGDIPAVVQEDSFYCGPAIMQSLLAYHGIHVEHSLLAVQMHTDPGTGTEYEDLTRVASEYILGKEPACDLDAGYRAAVLKDIGFNRSDMDLFLKRAGTDLQNGGPVIAGVDKAVLHADLGIQGVHVILLTGTNKAASSNEIVSFTAMDPSYVWQQPNPAFFTISTRQLYEAFATCKEPGYVW